MNAEKKPADEGGDEIKVYGRAGSTEGYDIRDFLTRTVVAFNWIDLVCEDDCRTELGLNDFDALRFPVVEFPGGERLFGPRVRESAGTGSMVCRSAAPGRRASPQRSMRPRKGYAQC